MRGSGYAHVLNRGNAGMTVFQSAAEYEELITMMDDARKRYGVDLLAFCVMPNHFHLVAHVDEAPALSAFMQQWLTSHVRRYQQRHQTTGHVWQGRFKSFLIQEDAHLLTVLRYVLMNPVRARLAASAWGWRWSSLWFDPMISVWPVDPPIGLRAWLGAALDEQQLVGVRESVRRGTPFGGADWREQVVRSHGLEHSVRRVGRH